MKATRDPELKILNSFKSYTGILNYSCILFILIAFIGIFCPFCSYNPSILDATKRNIQFWDLSFGYTSISIILLIFAFSLFEFCKFFTDWRSRKKLYIIFPVLVCFFVAVSYILITIGCVFYEIPEAEYSMLDIEFEAGFYLFTIGIFLFAIAYVVYCIYIVKIINGKIEVDSMVFYKSKTEKSDDKITKNNGNSTLYEKLSELDKLRAQNLISEEEFEKKKEEILRDFK